MLALTCEKPRGCLSSYLSWTAFNCVNRPSSVQAGSLHLRAQFLPGRNRRRQQSGWSNARVPMRLLGGIRRYHDHTIFTEQCRLRPAFHLFLDSRQCTYQPCFSRLRDASVFQTNAADNESIEIRSALNGSIFLGRAPQP